MVTTYSRGLVDLDSGLISRELFINQDVYDQELGAWARESRFSESNFRQFYAYWAKVMSGSSWSELS